MPLFYLIFEVYFLLDIKSSNKFFFQNVKVAVPLLSGHPCSNELNSQQLFFYHFSGIDVSFSLTALSCFFPAVSLQCSLVQFSSILSLLGFPQILDSGKLIFFPTKLSLLLAIISLNTCMSYCSFCLRLLLYMFGYLTLHSRSLEFCSFF